MSSLFDFEPKVDPYAVLGNPITHSQSPLIHSLFAKQTQQRIDYQAIHVDLGGFGQAVGNFFANGGKGLNVTVPFKRDAWELADSTSPAATRAGAVNTLVLQADKLIHGENTDGIGFIKDLTKNHNTTVKKQTLLILGAGGATRGLLGPILAEEPAEIIIANRTLDKASILVEEFTEFILGNTRLTCCGYHELGEQIFDIVINATSASLSDTALDLPVSIIKPSSCCYDLMYSANPTVFMKWCQNHGAIKQVDGLGMLVEQAAGSFYLWRGVQPETSAVISEVRKKLKS